MCNFSLGNEDSRGKLEGKELDNDDRVVDALEVTSTVYEGILREDAILD